MQQLATTEPQPFTFETREFLRLVELGAFRGHRVQLVNGVIVRMAPASSFHHSTVWKLEDVLRRIFGRRAMVRSQMAFAASPRSRPEPDVAVVPTGDYDAVDPDQAWLIVEVADSSLRFDRTVKSELYASAGVPEYWIVDLENRQVEVRTRPMGSRYLRTKLFDSGDLLPLPHTTKRIQVQDFLSSKRRG
jgi:Uma2 family endonuclease